LAFWRSLSPTRGWRFGRGCFVAFGFFVIILLPDLHLLQPNHLITKRLEALLVDLGKHLIQNTNSICTEPELGLATRTVFDIANQEQLVNR
jgi:hypothetical protein